MTREITHDAASGFLADCCFGFGRGAAIRRDETGVPGEIRTAFAFGANCGLYQVPGFKPCRAASLPDLHRAFICRLTDVFEYLAHATVSLSAASRFFLGDLV